MLLFCKNKGRIGNGNGEIKRWWGREKFINEKLLSYNNENKKQKTIGEDRKGV